MTKKNAANIHAVVVDVYALLQDAVSNGMEALLVLRAPNGEIGIVGADKNTATREL